MNNLNFFKIFLYIFLSLSLLFSEREKNKVIQSDLDSLSTLVIYELFLEKSRKKKNLSEKPLTDNADDTAEGPGKGNIFIFFLTHSFTNNAPGSEIEGVPASDINEIITSSSNNLIIFAKFFFSLNL